MTNINISTRDNILTVGNDVIDLEYQLASGHFTIRRPGAVYPVIRSAPVSVQLQLPMKARILDIFGTDLPEIQQQPHQDVHGQGWQITLVYPQVEPGVQLSLVLNIYENRPFLLMRLAVHNRGSRSFHLHDLSLIRAEKTVGGGADFSAETRPLDFFKVGWHDWCYTGLRHARQRDINTIIPQFIKEEHFNPTTPIPWKRGEFWGQNWGLLTDQKTAIVTGLATQADQFGLVHVNCLSSNGISLIAKCDGILFDPDERFTSEWGYVQFVDLPKFDPLEDYMQTVARAMNPRRQAASPGAKWTHWYHFFQSITEDLFLDNLDVIDKVRQEMPLATVQLDDGYQSAWGDWYQTNDKFPNGLSHLAKEIRARDFTPGLWLAPWVVDPRSQTAKQHPDWLVMDEKNRPIKSGYFYQFFGYALDSTNPSVLDHLRELSDTIAHQWGFKFVKTDFSYAGALPGKRFDPKATRAQAFRRGLMAIREGLGDDTFHLGCGCPFGPSIGIVDGMRIGPDTGPHWNPFIWGVPWATPLIKNERSIPGLRNNIRHTLSLAAMHKRWWWNDPDCLLVRDYDTRLTEAEVLSAVSLVGMQGGLVIDSDDLTRLSPERRRLISLLIPILCQDARPLDLLEREFPELYDLPMRQPWGDWYIVAIFNWDDRPARRWLDLTRVGVKGKNPHHVFDFWQRSYQAHTDSSIDLGVIPAHGCRLLRLCQVENKPTLVGDTLHIAQGGEIETMQLEGDSLDITIGKMGRKIEGELWVYLPVEPRLVTINGVPHKFQRYAGQVWTIPVALSDCN